MTGMMLAGALRVAAPTSATLAKLADSAGVDRRQASLARAGKPIAAGAHLALCGRVGIDPMDGAARVPKMVSPHVEWWLLAAGLYITRGLRRLDQRRAAKAIGISPATVCRIEACRPISIGNLIKVCRFIGVHVDGYTAPLAGHSGHVSHETTTETCCSVGGNRHGTIASAGSMTAGAAGERGAPS
jgi:DNA-binding Xre family transcriptional regulator